MYPDSMYPDSDMYPDAEPSVPGPYPESVPGGSLMLVGFTVLVGSGSVVLGSGSVVLGSPDSPVVTPSLSAPVVPDDIPCVDGIVGAVVTLTLPNESCLSSSPHPGPTRQVSSGADRAGIRQGRNGMMIPRIMPEPRAHAARKASAARAARETRVTLRCGGGGMRRLMVATILGGLALTGCSNELKGTIQVTAAGQTWNVMPSECASGQRQNFFGVDAREGTSDDKLVRVILDPKASYTLHLNVPGTDKGINLEGAGCSTFDIVVERQNSSINDITNVKGHIRVACDLPDLKVNADLTFSNCH